MFSAVVLRIAASVPFTADPHQFTSLRKCMRRAERWADATSEDIPDGYWRASVDKRDGNGDFGLRCLDDDDVLYLFLQKRQCW